MLIISALWIFFHNDILLKTDEVFLSLFGKTLNGRNILIRAAIIGSLFLLSILIPVILRRMIDKDRKFRYAADSLILILLAVPSVQMLIICANQVLRRDDYWEIADALQYGFPGSIFYEIQRFNGRYTGWGLRSLHALLPSVPYIDIFLFLDLILLTTGTSMLCHRLLKAQAGQGKAYPGSRFQAFVMGFGLSLAFVLLSSNVFEFWFWGSGTMIYGFGVSMCILTIALVWNAADDSTVRRRKMFLSCLSCFITCGCSELCTASLAAFLMLLLIWKKIQNGKWNRRLIFVIAEIMLCCILIFTGSASLDFSGTSAHWENRQAGSSGSGFFSRLWGAFDWAFNGLQGYTFINSRLLILFLITAFLTGTQLHFTKKARISILILAVSLIIIAHAVLMINTLLDYMPPRVITVGICWYFTAMSLLSLTLGSLLCPKSQSQPDRIKLLLCALLFMITAAGFYRENIQTLRSVRLSWSIRDRLIRIAGDSEEPLLTCSIPSPGSSREDILADPQSDFNLGTARYYQVSEIAAEVRCPPWGEFFLPEDPWK